MKIHSVVKVEDQCLHLRIGTNLNVSTVVNINIPRNNVGNFIGAHMIYPLAVSNEEDQVVIGAVASLVKTI